MYKVIGKGGSLALCGVFLWLAWMSQPAFAGKKRYVGQPAPRAQQVSVEQIDHAAWDELLTQHVDDRGRVDYRAWHASPDDVAKLDRYLRTLSTASLDKPASDKAKLVFWINAYNALTVRGILQEYPTSSIRNHTATLLGYNIWNDLLLHVGEETISLDAIEHQVLRKMGEPRIHFAIVCASHSCPRLLNRAYTTEKLQSQLVENTKDFFANRENFRYDAGRQRIELSAIMKWFGEDFGSNQAAQLQSIAAYLPDQASRAAAQRGDVRVSYLPYDWSLNEQPSEKK